DWRAGAWADSAAAATEKYGTPPASRQKNWPHAGCEWHLSSGCLTGTLGRTLLGGALCRPEIENGAQVKHQGKDNFQAAHHGRQRRWIRPCPDHAFHEVKQNQHGCPLQGVKMPFQHPAQW